MREINCSSIVFTDTLLDLALGAFGEILTERHASEWHIFYFTSIAKAVDRLRFGANLPLPQQTRFNIWHFTSTECNTHKYFQIKSDYQIHEHITCNSTDFRASPWAFRPSKKGREEIQPNHVFYVKFCIVGLRSRLRHRTFLSFFGWSALI
jgi:hypothetical protein